MKNTVKYSGCWVKSSDKYICRYLISWIEISKNNYCGCIAGFSGHGAFEVEKFYLKGDKRSIQSLWIDFTDVITGDEVEFDSLGSEILSGCILCDDLAWELNDYESWSDEDQLVLSKKMFAEIDPTVDECYLSNAPAPFFAKPACLAIGLTSAPAN